MACLKLFYIQISWNECRNYIVSWSFDIKLKFEVVGLCKYSIIPFTRILFTLFLNRGTKWTTSWPLTSARCWPQWASSGAHVATAGERLTGGRRPSCCACSGVWVSRAAGAGPSPGSCGGWAAVPLTARRAPFALMMLYHPSPARTTTSDSEGQICSPPVFQILNLTSKEDYSMILMKHWKIDVLLCMHEAWSKWLAVDTWL